MDLIVCTKKCNLYIVSPTHYTVNNFVLSLIYNYLENSSKYAYKYKYLGIKYKYKYSTFKYKYEYKYLESVLELYSSTSTSTKYYISAV